MRVAAYNAERILNAVLLAAWCGVVFGGVSAAWAVARSLTTDDRLLLREVEIEGNVELSEDEVLASTSLDRVTTVLALDLERIEAALAAEPWVAAVDVRMSRANRLEIELQERRAVALAATPEPYLVAADGALIVTVRDMLPPLPLITGVVGGPEDDLSVDGGALVDALHFLELWAQTDHGDQVDEIGYDVVQGMRVVFASGLVTLLSGDALNDELRRLVAVRQRIEEEGVEVVQIDLRYGDEAIIQLDSSRQQGADDE